MRRTGKYYWLTLGFAALGLSTNIAVAFWGKHTSPVHFWIDVIGQSMGFAGLLTTTLIVGFIYVYALARPHTIIQGMIATVGKEDMAVATGSMVSFFVAAKSRPSPIC
jgi:hypothetical protein